MPHNENEEVRLCLNLKKVREGMRRKRLSQKKLAAMIGMKDPHTIAYYFNNPDKIRLSHVTAIAKVLSESHYLFDDYIVRVNTDKEYRTLISGED